MVSCSLGKTRTARKTPQAVSWSEEVMLYMIEIFGVKTIQLSLYVAKKYKELAQIYKTVLVMIIKASIN